MNALRRIFISILVISLFPAAACVPDPAASAGVHWNQTHAFIQNDAGLGRPYEDASYAYGNVFVVADGVSRSDTEYYRETDESPAAVAAQRTVACVGRVLSSSRYRKCSPFRAARRASSSVGRYNRLEKLAVPAASSYVAAVIQDGILYYSYIGDNHLLLLHGNTVTEICKKQTDPVHAAGGAAGLGMTREEYYREVVNNSRREDGLGYGVITGQPRALDFLVTGNFSLESGDRVILSSDGLDSFFLHAEPSSLKSLTAKEIIAVSETYDRRPYGSYRHDKTLIVVDII